MAPFDDPTDPELGEACDRLAVWIELLAPGTLIDAGSGLTERDLALMLRHLHRTRLDASTDTSAAKKAGRWIGRLSSRLSHIGDAAHLYAWSHLGYAFMRC